MSQITIAEHLTADELREKMSSSKSKEQFQRWQVIYGIKVLGMSAQEIAKIVGIANGTVYQFVFRYNHGGAQEYEIKPRGGRKYAYMTLDEEGELLANMQDDACKGLLISAGDVQQRIKEITGLEVSEDYVYDLFRRHEWRKIKPRPYHPKRDKEKQEEFKKNSLKLWLPRQKSSAQTTNDH
jgi:transposase